VPQPSDPKSIRRPSRASVQRGNALLWLVIVLTATAAILSYRVILIKFDSQLHKAVHNRFQEMFPATKIYVGKVAYTDEGGVVVNDLRLAVANGKNWRGTKYQPVVSCERVLLSGNLDVAHWIKQTIRISQLDLHGLQLDAWPNAAGQWSLEKLRPKSGASTCTPVVVVHDAMLKIHRDDTLGDSPVVLHDIAGRIEPVTPSIVNQCSPSTIAIRLTASSSGLVKGLTMKGQIDPIHQQWTVHGEINDLGFNREFMQQVPAQASQYLKQLAGLECRASLVYSVTGKKNQTPKFELRGKLSDGRLQDVRLPYPVEKAGGDFFCDNELLQLRDLKATSGGAILTLNTDILGFKLDVPMTIDVQADNLELDRRLYSSLPATWQGYWDRLKLEGTVDAHLRMEFDGKTWMPNVHIQCRDISMVPWLFPFPMTNVNGLVVLQNKQVSSDLLTGMAGGQPAEGNFNLSSIDGQWFGQLNCRTKAPITLDEQLIASLTPTGLPKSPTENFVRSLHPSGTIELTLASFQRSSTPGDIWHRNIAANVYGGKIQYDGFPYPIHDIRGRIAGQDDSWRLEQFEGRNDSGRILCSGEWQSVKSGQVPLHLRFTSFAVPLEEELKHALPEDGQYVWNQLQPSGAIDSVDVEIHRPDSSSPSQLMVHIREDSASNEATGRSLRLYPKEFPYWLTDVECDIRYSPGRVDIQSATAANGPSRISLEGKCLRDERKQQWTATMHWLPSTRLMVDREFLQAIPENVRQSLLRLDFRGAVSVLGKSEVVLAPKVGQGISTSWNCELDLENARLGDGKYIDAMRGTISVSGKNDGKSIVATGNVLMDALTVKGVAVTRLTGPFSLVGSQIFFGSAVNQTADNDANRISKDITAEALAGTLQLNGHGTLDTGKFYTYAELKDADLTGLLQDVGVNRSTTKAKCNASMDFSGVPWNPQTYNGKGRIELTDANLYQLPFMIRLLSLTPAARRDDVAFDHAQIDFTLDGDQIPLTVVCDGDMLRMKGEGWTNLRREIQLELYTWVGRRGSVRQMLDPMFESGYGAAAKIEIDGTLDNPNMQRRQFPQLEQMFPEVAERRQQNPILPWRR
jgi:AsmA-like C-terminal region